jgi:hypothetical protein
MAQGVAPYRQLTVDDFPVNKAAPKNQAFYIKTALRPGYYLSVKFYNGFYYAQVDQWLIFSGFEKNETWRHPQAKELKAELPYGQAILDVNEIHARRLAALKPGELPNARATTMEEAQAELRRKLEEFISLKYKEAEAEMQAFSKATNQGADKKKVRVLGAEIRKRLEATPAANVQFTEPAAASSPTPAASLSPTPQ